jgi:hypothetical protein
VAQMMCVLPRTLLAMTAQIRSFLVFAIHEDVARARLFPALRSNPREQVVTLRCTPLTGGQRQGGT